LKIGFRFTMEITSGSRLGPYEIGPRLGAGGMGEVYRGRDTRLDRSVAIKVLPANLAGNAQMKARFEREARAISQLNHPNICTLYDVGDGYLVMELLDGESLADRLLRGPLPMAEVLRYGAQIADALDRAHRSGIVHRDLKPGNIMLTRAGAKLLDFGLAKSNPIRFGNDATTMHHQPLTEEGTILGTFMYMAPEQLEGLEADGRTDIFAFGTLLYEMATGRHPFKGATKTSLIAAIVSGEPPAMSEVAPLTPPLFEHVIRKCMEKDPEQRWQSVYDIATELRWIGERGTCKEVVPARRALLPWLVAAFGVVMAAVFAAVAWRMPASRTSVSAFTLIPPSGTFTAFPKTSPDGKAIVFGATAPGDEKSMLWIRTIGDLAPRKLAGTEQSTQPFWSPDGQSIAFFQENRLKVLDLTSGKPRDLCEANYGLGGAWTDDGTIVFCPAWGGGLLRVPAAGGKPLPLTGLDSARREAVHAWPATIPGTKTILFLNRGAPGQAHIAAVSLDEGKAKAIVDADSFVGYAEPYVLYVREGVILAQELDKRSLTVRGAPRPVADGANYSSAWAHSGGSAGGDTMAYYAQRQQPSILEWINRDGTRVTVFEDDNVRSATLSPDGRFIAFGRDGNDRGGQDLWLFDLRRSLRTRLTSNPGDDEIAVWSPDSRQIAFRSERNGLYEVFVQQANGSASAKRVWSGPNDLGVVDWSRDGKRLLVSVQDQKYGSDLWIYDLSSRKGSPVMTTEAQEFDGRFSPDGKWITFQSDRSGRDEVYALNLETKDSMQISTNGGTDMRWNGDGIYYSTPDGRTLLTKLRYEGSSIEPAAPVEVQSAVPEAIAYDIGRDGSRVLVARNKEKAKQELNVLVGWQSRLRRPSKP